MGAVSKSVVLTCYHSKAEVGSEYEVVITNSSGLYRHRLGDVVRVTGKYNEAPRVQILGKRAHLLAQQGKEESPEDVKEKRE